MSAYDTQQIGDDEYELIERAWTLNLMGQSTYQIGRELELDMRRVEQYIALRRSLGPRPRRPRQPPPPPLPVVARVPRPEAQQAVNNFLALAQAANHMAYTAANREAAAQAQRIAYEAQQMAAAYRKQLETP